MAEPTDPAPPAPLFTDTLHIAFVVRDLNAALATYYHEYGVGPWSIYRVGSDTVTDLVRGDEPARFSLRIGVATVGRLQWELVQPLDDASEYADVLRARGEGFHHLAVDVPDYHAAVERLRAKGHPVLMAGMYNGNLFAQFGTGPDLGFATEIHLASGTAAVPEGVYPAVA